MDYFTFAADNARSEFRRRFDDLPTLAERPRCAVPKHALKTRLEAEEQARALDGRRLDAWRKAVWIRDKGRCRCCGVKVRRVLDLVSDRAECHHVMGRDHRATRYDVRNGLLLCHAPCHERVTGTVKAKVLIVGTQFFEVDGGTYIDASEPVTFTEAV